MTADDQRTVLAAILDRVVAAEESDRDVDAALCVLLAPPHILTHWMAAPGDYRPLDRAKWRNVGGGYVGHPDWVSDMSGPGKAQAPAYTASVECALALVWRALPGARTLVERDHDGTGWALVQEVQLGPRSMCYAKTQALAVVQALLKALVAEGT